jgi:hypothetical protein
MLAVEEKLDGANCAISFTETGKLRLQSRGHFLDGGVREGQFNLLKSWAVSHGNALWQVLGSRYTVYGEWLYAKHTVFYDLLPHYFLEFDILDRPKGVFLATEERRRLLAGLAIPAAPVLHQGPCQRLEDLMRLIGRSLYKSPKWRTSLLTAARAVGVSESDVTRQTDQSDEMEGLYIKVEEEGRVVERLKFIRASFLSTVLQSGGHWMDRPIIANRLAPAVDLFGGDAPSCSN